MSVLILTEDKTGGGLEAFIKKAVNARRTRPLAITLGSGWVRTNADLLKRCRAYSTERFTRARPRHVVYVLDARNCWRLCQVEEPRPPHTVQSLEPHLARVRAHMTRLAQEGATNWREIADGFHPHVLVWERESLMLPVADGIGLGDPEPDVYGTHGASDWVKRRFDMPGRQGYAKSVQGNLLLMDIVKNDDLMDRVLASNPSLRAIVDDLVRIQ